MFFKSKKRIKELEEEVTKLNEQIKELYEEMMNYKKLYEMEKDTTEIQNNVIKMKNEKNSNLEQRRRKNASAIGGLKKEMNKLREENKELKNKVKELSSGAYLRIKLKAQKTPKAEPIRIKSFSKTSNIARKHQEEIENESN